MGLFLLLLLFILVYYSIICTRFLKIIATNTLDVKVVLFDL